MEWAPPWDEMCGEAASAQRFRKLINWYPTNEVSETVQYRLDRNMGVSRGNVGRRWTRVPYQLVDV